MKPASMGDVSNGNFLRVEFLIAGSGDGGSREMVLARRALRPNEYISVAVRTEVGLVSDLYTYAC